MTTTLEAPDVYDAARIDGVRPADVARLAEVATALARNGLVTVGRRGGGMALQPRQQAPRALAVALRRSFADLGPTFIKFGQLIASSPGLFPEFLSSEFRRLLDSVPPEPVGRVRGVIEREFGRPLAETFADFDDRPLAAASVAQVHRGVLHDGTEVAVKVRRPRLRARIEQDLRLLRLLAGVLARAGALGETLNPTAVVEDLAATIRAELDFRAEAESMVAFAANLESSGADHGCVVPRPIDGLVTERVLVMTFVEGVPVDDGSALRAAGHDLEGLVRTGVRAWLEGALAHGLFHGDVHAGNLFVTPAGQIAFLDFGIMGRLDERTRLVLRRALPALLIDGDFRSVVRAVFDLGAATGPVDVEAATADVRELLEPLAAKPMGEISYGELLGHVLSVATRYHVVLPRELVLVVKQLVYFERYAKELAPRYRILADPTILGHLVDDRARTAEPPSVRARADTRELDGPGGGLAVPRVGEVRFSWDYTRSQRDLTKLYEKAKRSQWNTATDIDWSIDVDPLDTGGMASYLPMVAAESFERFSDAERAEAARQFNAWITSQFLHGEQGALLATAKLVEEVPWTEAKYYGATQVMDEARHVEAYARYLDDKLGLAYPVNDNLRQLLEMVVTDARWDITYLGMQIIVEGIALAAFGLIHQFSTEPLIKQITRYVMADEARHVAFGTLSLAGLYDEMAGAERAEREDFVVEAAWLMRDRFLATEVWERLGIPLDDGLRDSANSPMLQLFQRVLFAKITPNLRKIGLLSERLTGRLVGIGAMPPEDL
ncbi:MAG TPA: AarF/UbiB family protein [Acidimicrobiales bacterium]|nr:AarF/UbiB family protein [Acidimicrobiales bacterium]